MLRGSKPGERRGGRNRGVPNRRSILRDRILAIGLEHPTASQSAVLLKLVKDCKLPPDTRIAIGPKCFPPKRRRASSTKSQPVPAKPEWTPQALEALFGVVQDATANSKMRRKAAQKIAEFLLPKSAKKPKLTPDEYGFSMRPNLASAYRDMQLELQSLLSKPTRKIPAIADRIKKLQARSTAIRQRVELPCPTRYGDKESFSDYQRLMEFASLRVAGTALTEAQNAEEAHLRARYDVFCAGPESVARRHRAALEDAELQFQKSQLFRQFYAPPLSPKQRNDLELLRWLYPKPYVVLSNLEGEDIDVYCHHPFVDDTEVLAPDGTSYFYPPDSKLCPAAPAEVSR